MAGGELDWERNFVSDDAGGGGGAVEKLKFDGIRKCFRVGKGNESWIDKVIGCPGIDESEEIALSIRVGIDTDVEIEGTRRRGCTETRNGYRASR